MKNKTALLIIDVQVLLFEREKFDGKKVYLGEQLLSNINTLAQKARNADVPVIYIQHTGDDGAINAKGMPLWEVHPTIKPQKGDIAITKTNADSFLNTGLQEKLQELNITDLVITGMQTEYCVDTTCRRAFSLGYSTILVSDGHSTFDTEALPASSIVDYHNGILGGREPFTEKFTTLKSTNEIEF